MGVCAWRAAAASVVLIALSALPAKMTSSCRLAASGAALKLSMFQQSAECYYGDMDAPDELEHDIPFPLFARGMIFAMGLAAVILPVWELWRGVWPLNVTSPFFALLIGGGCFVGFSALSAAVYGGDAALVFRHGELEVRHVSLWQKRVRVFAVSSIVSINTQRLSDSDGPDQWHVNISLQSGENFASRRFDTEVTARKWEATFKRALGL